MLAMRLRAWLGVPFTPSRSGPAKPRGAPPFSHEVGGPENGYVGHHLDLPEVCRVGTVRTIDAATPCTLTAHPWDHNSTRSANVSDFVASRTSSNGKKHSGEPSRRRTRVQCSASASTRFHSASSFTRWSTAVIGPTVSGVSHLEAVPVVENGASPVDRAGVGAVVGDKPNGDVLTEGSWNRAVDQAGQQPTAHPARPTDPADERGGENVRCTLRIIERTHRTLFRLLRTPGVRGAGSQIGALVSLQCTRMRARVATAAAVAPVAGLVARPLHSADEQRSPTGAAVAREQPQMTASAWPDDESVLPQEHLSRHIRAGARFLTTAVLDALQQQHVVPHTLLLCKRTSHGPWSVLAAYHKPQGEPGATECIRVSDVAASLGIDGRGNHPEREKQVSTVGLLLLHPALARTVALFRRKGLTLEGLRHTGTARAIATRSDQVDHHALLGLRATSFSGVERAQSTPLSIGDVDAQRDKAQHASLKLI
eukprot:4646377-Prymnesium_polylepis.3